MKTTKLRVLRFHTGRGGRFNNAGYVTFQGFEKIQDNSVCFEDLAFQETKNGNPVMSEWGGQVLLNGAGNEVDYCINADGTGYVNIDHDYDSDHWVIENELLEQQISALQREASVGFYDAEARKIIEEHYPNYVLDEWYNENN